MYVLIVETEGKQKDKPSQHICSFEGSPLLTNDVAFAKKIAADMQRRLGDHPEEIHYVVYKLVKVSK